MTAVLVIVAVATALGQEAPRRGPVPVRTAPTGSSLTPAAVLARFAHEPAVRDLQRAAARWVGADPARLRDWRRRVRKAPWLPQLRVRVLRGFEDDLLTNATGQTRALDDDLTIEVRAQWELDRVLFDRNELYLSRETALLAELRHDVVAEVTRLYFERRRRQVELLLQAPSSTAERLRLELRVDELTADLDALTGGLLTRALRGRK